MAEPPAAKISDNPLDFVQFVLYVRKSIPACEQLMAQVSHRMDVLIQDVDLIQGDRPHWLQGVPTLVKLPEREVFVGTRALQCIREQAMTTVRGIDANTFGGGEAPRSGAPLSGEGEPPVGGFRDLFTLNEEPEMALPLAAPSADGKYEDVPRTKTHNVSLEDIMRRRA